MQVLHAKTNTTWESDPFVVRVSRMADRPTPYKELEALIVDDKCSGVCGFHTYFRLANTTEVPRFADGAQTPMIDLPLALSYLSDGDIVRVDPRQGEIRVLYRRNSRFNSLFVAQQCNNKCLMCSQPPRNREDPSLVKDVLAALPLMHIDTPELVITGGEPTLLGDDLLWVIRCCASYLPHTSVLLLSNGRFFAYLSFCLALRKVLHPDLTVGIPLYSHISDEHDFIVQTSGAFDQTIIGLMNLGRCRQRIELRVVIHRLNYHRLPELADFIARNLPFVSHVALMGMEPRGYAKANLDQLWIDPVEYSASLYEAVRRLARHQICTSIYNHQLCVLDPRLWRYARQSISDWKKIFLAECEECAVRASCSGFFASAVDQHSVSIKPVPSA